MKEKNFNCYFTPGLRPLWVYKIGFKQKTKPWPIERVRTELGHDRDSIVADPLFVDPTSGDYRVKPESSALKLGFRNFPMEFGVTAPRLVALLPDRVFPSLEPPRPSGPEHAAKRSAGEQSFMGCTVKNMTTEEEKSAVGIGEITGVLVLRVADSTPLAEAGLSEGDLIISCNGKKVDDFKTLQDFVDKARGRQFELQVHDDSTERRYRVKKKPTRSTPR